MQRLLVLLVLAALTRANERIVGGEDANIEDFPWQVSLQRFSHFCGGSLIKPDVILTAAHCTYGQGHQNLYVYAGQTILTSTPYFKTVKKVYQHPDFVLNTVDNDVSLLHLNGAFTLNDKIKTISLVGADFKIPVGQVATVTGYGKTSEEEPSAKRLKRLDVPLLSTEKCKYLYSKVNKTITEHMFCAGFEEGGKDSCGGDSGGPIVLDGKQIGIVSWGLGCARKDLPGVYASVASEMEFIAKSLKEIGY